MKATFEELLACMEGFHQMFKDDYELDDVAISFCESIDMENAVIDAVWALPFLQGVSRHEVIQKELGLHCEIENDANCAALSEVYFGKAQDIKNMAFFAIIRDRQVCSGAHRYGDEFGMMLVEDEKSNVQNFSLIASTSSMVRKMEETTNESWDGVRIFEEANAGNALCKEVIKQFYHKGVFNIQHTLDPKMILFGGAISQRDDFVERLMEEYNKIREKIDIDIITPNLLGALANYISRNEWWAEACNVPLIYFALFR